MLETPWRRELPHTHNCLSFVFSCSLSPQLPLTFPTLFSSTLPSSSPSPHSPLSSSSPSPHSPLPSSSPSPHSPLPSSSPSPHSPLPSSSPSPYSPLPSSSPSPSPHSPLPACGHLLLSTEGEVANGEQ